MSFTDTDGLSSLLDDVADFFVANGHSVNVMACVGAPRDLAGKYPDPVDYCREVLKIETLTEQQQKVMRLCTQAPYKVLVPSGHTTGKTFLAACLVSWWFDTFDPSIVLTTAPTERQVKDLLWKEVRAQRAKAGLGGFIGPREPRMETGPEHYAQGFTARDENSFQGHHGPRMLIIFDEAQGIEAPFWEALRSMLTGGRWAFLAIYNPIGQGSRVFKEESSPTYHPVVRMSCLDHPNIKAELEGKPPPIPSAIRLADIKLMLQDWATPMEARDAGPEDICIDGQWWQLGPIADARIAGRWPRQPVNSVWSATVFDECVARRIVDAGTIQIGCDVARYGDDFTTIHVRKGFVSLHHERHNGWNTTQTTMRLIDLTVEFAERYKAEKIQPKKICVAIDDTGVGGGVTDQGQSRGYMFVPVNAQWSVEALEDRYNNLRSALWFGVYEENAKKGKLSLAKLPKHILDLLKEQLCMQKYEHDPRSRRVVWSKKEMKKLVDYSPDDADAFNLAYLDLSYLDAKVSGRITVPQ